MINDFNAKTRYDMIQKLEKANIKVDGYYRRHRKNWRIVDALGWMAVGVMFATGVTMLAQSCENRDYKNPPKQLDCGKCHGLKVKMVEYFKSTSKNPQAMAESVMRTKSPRLMAAIAKVETGGNNVKNTGYKKRHSGSFQVNEKTWGKVGDITEQGLQAELVLQTHLEEEKKIIPALNAYGGQSEKSRYKNSYAQAVLSELANVP